MARLKKKPRLRDWLPLGRRSSLIGRPGGRCPALPTFRKLGELPDLAHSCERSGSLDCLPIAGATLDDHLPSLRSLKSIQKDHSRSPLLQSSAMESKDKSSRSGSRANLNESTLPLLDDVADTKGEDLRKEKIELETKAGGADSGSKGEDSNAATAEPGSDTGKDVAESDKEDKKGSKKKAKKEKKEKKVHKRSPSCVETLTIGLNLLDRDEKHVNDHVNLVFEDVLAEPDASHGFDGAWKLTYLVFSTTRLWCYRLLSALLALPCGFTWGLLFSIISLLHVWLFTPLLRIFDVLLHVLHRVWGGLVRTLLDPVFQSIGRVAGDVRVTRTQVYPKNDFASDP